MVVTTNCSSQVFITSKKIHPRLHIFTGKGGTGKTTLAQSFALSLKDEGKKVYYVAFDQAPDHQTCRQLNLPLLPLIQEDITLEYVTDKLGTRILANWIIQTSFFKALYQMLPGIMYLILLSSVLKRLEREKDLHLVLDLPSTGHALTMFEAPHNFSAMFERGPLFEDLKIIKSQLFNPHFTELIICSLASELAYSEATELVEDLRRLELKKITILFNNSLAPLGLDEKQLPTILKKKIKYERKVLEQGLEDGVKFVIPTISLKTQAERVKAIAKLWEEIR